MARSHVYHIECRKEIEGEVVFLADVKCSEGKPTEGFEIAVLFVDNDVKYFTPIAYTRPNGKHHKIKEHITYLVDDMMEYHEVHRKYVVRPRNRVSKYQKELDTEMDIEKRWKQEGEK